MGCLGDEDFYPMDAGESQEDDDDDDDSEFDIDLVLDGDYSGWESGGDDFAPGDIESLVEDDAHSGFGQARCFICHGQGRPDEPEDHDPAMQHWSWSCARGFPGASCHGHGVNGASQFNHDGDPAFDGCTQKWCHFLYDSEPRYENHGFTDAPDEFCNACHDFYWEDWP